MQYRPITDVRFEPWEPHRIVPGIKRGWPERILHVAAAHTTAPPPLNGRLEGRAWSEAAACIEPDVAFVHDNPPVHTGVLFCYDNSHLYVGIRAALPAPADASTPYAEQEADVRWTEENVTVALDPEHDHWGMVTVSINALGVVEYVREGFRSDGLTDEVGYQTEDVLREAMNPDPRACAAELGIRGAACIRDDAWTAELAIPLAALGAERPLPGRTMGLDVVRTVSERPFEAFAYHFTWMKQYPGTLLSPVKMGCLSFGPPGLVLETIDFPNCTWGINEGVVRLTNPSPTERSFVLYATGRLPGTGGDAYAHPPVRTGPLSVAPGASVEARFTYHMPVRFMPTLIDLKAVDARAGDPLMRMGFQLGACAVVYPFGQEQGMPSPEPDDPNFVEKRMRCIVARQPLLRRRTTAQGAPCDFYIEAVDGTVAFNLMQPDALQAMADWLCELYDNDIDRLIGSAFFLSQQAVHLYASRRCELAGRATALSGLRVGGGMCGEFARVHTGLLHRMTSVKTGRPFRARNFGVTGHGLTTVMLDGRWVLLDPTTHNFKAYFMRDNRNLAGYRDLRNDPSLITYNGSALMKLAGPTTGHQVAYGSVWPDGAPHDVPCA